MNLSPGVEDCPDPFFTVISIQMTENCNFRTYSGDLKSNHLKSGNILNPDFLKVGFQMVRFSNGYSYSPNHSKSGLSEGQISNGPAFKWLGFSNGYSYSPNHSKSERFCLDFKCFFDKMAAICPDFKSHSKSRPFATQPLLDHLKSRQGRISDPNCIVQYSNG